MVANPPPPPAEGAAMTFEELERARREEIWAEENARITARNKDVDRRARQACDNAVLVYKIGARVAANL